MESKSQMEPASCVSVVNFLLYISQLFYIILSQKKIKTTTLIFSTLTIILEIFSLGIWDEFKTLFVSAH